MRSSLGRVRPSSIFETRNTASNLETTSAIFFLGDLACAAAFDFPSKLMLLGHLLTALPGPE